MHKNNPVTNNLVLRQNTCTAYI